ncbi:MAG: DUF1684 domain-containing protein [Actinomycetota bacterium]
MTIPTEILDDLSVIDYRRQVAELYVELRRHGPGPDAWARWAERRRRLLLEHPSSALVGPGAPQPPPATVDYFDYDPTWSVVGTVVPPAAGDGPAHETADDDPSEGGSTFRRFAAVRFERLGVRHELVLFRLDAYGGGLFLPFTDATGGTSTYGGGRYLLDGAKSADLGSPGPGLLHLDFNFAYHPSCAWDPQWPCPLAPPSNRLDVAVEAGERLTGSTREGSARPARA